MVSVISYPLIRCYSRMSWPMFEFDNIYARSGNQEWYHIQSSSRSPSSWMVTLETNLPDAFALNMMPYLVYYNLLMP